jgi:hypothetical protein
MLVNHPRINTAINWVLTTLSRIDKGIRTSVDTPQGLPSGPSP